MCTRIRPVQVRHSKYPSLLSLLLLLLSSHHHYYYTFTPSPPRGISTGCQRLVLSQHTSCSMTDDITLSSSNTLITSSCQCALINIHVANIPKVVWDNRAGLSARRQAGKLKDLGFHSILALLSVQKLSFMDTGDDVGFNVLRSRADVLGTNGHCQ